MKIIYLSFDYEQEYAAIDYEGTHPSYGDRLRKGIYQYHECGITIAFNIEREV